MGVYIFRILAANSKVACSWGIYDIKPYKDRLEFIVNGFLFKGKVCVLYDAGWDTFTVKLINNDGSVKEEIEMVYIDNLVRVIDEKVEKCDNYKEKVIESLKNL